MSETMDLRDELHREIGHIDAMSTGDDIRDVLYLMANRIVEQDAKHQRLIRAMIRGVGASLK